MIEKVKNLVELLEIALEEKRGYSSVVERSAHIRKATGSKPVIPTKT